MANSDSSSSRILLDRRVSVLSSSSGASGVVPYDRHGPQPAAPPPRTNARGAHDASRHVQPSPAPPSATPPAVPPQGATQWHHSVYAAPPYWYDSSRYRQPSAMPGPPSDPTAVMLMPVLTLLNALQSQFSVFQENLGNVRSDVKDVLSQLGALRTAQAKTNKSLAELEGVIGAPPAGTTSRGRKRSTPRTEEADIPDKTLAQSLASIQFMIDEPSARVLGQAFDHPAPQYPALSVTLSGEASLPTSGLQSAPSQTGPEYADASIQTLMSLTPVGSLPLSRTRLPVAPNADWAVEHHVHDSAISTVHNTEYLPPRGDQNRREMNPVARQGDCDVLPCNLAAANLNAPMTPNAGPPGASVAPCSLEISTYMPINTHASASSSSSQSTPVASNAGRSVSARNLDTFIPALAAGVDPASSAVSVTTNAGPSRSSAVPPFSNSALKAQFAKVVHGPRPATFRNICLRPADNLLLPLAPSLSAQSSDGSRSTSVASTPKSEVLAAFPGPPHLQMHTKNTSVASDPNGIEVCVTAGAKIAPQSVPAIPERGRQVLSLPTPPSDGVTAGREPHGVSSLMHNNLGAATESGAEACAKSCWDLSLVHTPPGLTPETSGGEDWPVVAGVQGQGSVGNSNQLSPLTPLHSPSPGPAKLLSDEDVSVRVATRHTLPVDSAGNTVSGGKAVTQRIHADAPKKNNSATVFQSGQAATGVAVSNEHSAQPFGDINLSMEPDSTGRSNPEQHTENNIFPSYAHASDLGLDRSPSPLSPRLPPTPPGRSWCATPSSPSGSRPTPDEDEVVNALMFGASAMSTPTLDAPRSSPFTAACANHSAMDDGPSTVPQILAVAPSMLHNSTPAACPETPPSREHVHHTLTPLTPLGSESTDGGDSEGYREPPRRFVKKPRFSVVVSADESPRSSSRGPIIGGPNASLDELVLLARRDTPKIQLKVPERRKKLKRKRDGDDDDAEGAGRMRVNESANSKRGPRGTAEDRLQGGRRDGLSAGVSRTVASHTEALTSRTMQSVFRTAREDSVSGDVVNASEHPAMTSPLRSPRKKVKGESEAGGMATDATASESAGRKPRPISKAKAKSPLKYHVWDGEILGVEARQRPELHVRLKEAGSASLTPPRVRRREEKPPEARLLSPARISTHFSPRNRRPTGPSPTKEDVKISKKLEYGPSWPECPEILTHWNAQFIQCDNCDNWYHYGCAGIESGDSRLEPGAMYICPVCYAQNGRRKAAKNQEDRCMRPDCPAPQVVEDTELYFVERLVGRKRTEGYVYMWLAKWEGYPMSQSTWIPKENVVGDGNKLFSAFLQDAAAEGADLSKDMVLLKEALGAGWVA